MERRSPDRPADADRRRHWQAATRRLAAEINAGWWLSAFLPPAAAVGLAGMVVLLYARWRWPDATALVWAGLSAAFVATGIAAWWRVRRRFECEATAQVRLEAALGLEARLSAASAGVGAWPPPPAAAVTRARWPVLWRWRQPAGMAAFIAVLLALASWVPIAGLAAARRHVIERPADVRLVEQWLETLAEEKLVDERSLDTIDDKIRELVERPAQEWYEHASLEAAGTLKEQTAADMRALADNLARAEQAAAAVAALGQSLPEAVRAALAKEFAAAVAAFAAGTLVPAGDLAALLREIDPATLGSLSPEQLAALAKRLSANRKALQDALATCRGFDLGGLDGWCDACSGRGACGECRGCKAGKPCVKACAKCGRCAGGVPGRGGVSRGRADAGMSFGEKNDLGTSRAEKIAAPTDAERSLPGEVVAVLDGEHEVDEDTYAGPRSGGGVSGPGDGGAAVQVDSLPPAEQATVRRFFQ